MVLLLLLTSTLLVAYANGANDNFKGVATLYGSNTLGYRAALRLATVATLLGSLTALSFGAALVASFSGRGLVPDAVAGDPAFMTAVGLGAAGTVLLATWLGFPISTTHALVGALLGTGIVEAGSAVNVGRLGSMLVAPLLFSPLVASVLASAHYPVLHSLRQRLGVSGEACVCIGEELIPIAAIGGAAVAPRAPTMTVGTRAACSQRYNGEVVGISAGGLLNGLHYASAAAVSFARGVNDTPKIVALLLAVRLVSTEAGLLLVGAAIAVGGLLGARRVADTMSHQITTLTPGQALSSNLTTALLVLGASRFGLPVSTTHVSVGALTGVGLASGGVRWKTIKRILVAWVTTVPLAALLAGGIALLAR